MTLILKDPRNEDLKGVAKKIREGESCIYPTETCYGLGTNALDEEAVKKIYSIKERDMGKKLSCIVSSVEQAEKYCELNTVERDVCNEFMPGPLTLVAKKKNTVPDILNKDFVFRVSSNPIAQKLAQESGVPIVATSANFSGTGGRYSLDDISRVIRDRVDIILDYGELEKQEPSTIAKIDKRNVEIYRKGPVSRKQIERFLNI